MKISTINTTTNTTAIAITAIAKGIVAAVSSSVMSSWRDRSMGHSKVRGNKRVVVVSEHRRSVIGQPTFGLHLLGLLGHRFNLAALAPAAPVPAMVCCSNYRPTQQSRPRFA